MLSAQRVQVDLLQSTAEFSNFLVIKIGKCNPQEALLAGAEHGAGQAQHVMRSGQVACHIVGTAGVERVFQIRAVNSSR